MGTLFDEQSQPNPNENLKEYEEAKETLGIEVEETLTDKNLIKVSGKIESLEKIFPDIFEGLDSKTHTTQEIEAGWRHVKDFRHLRPGAGTYSLTVNNRGVIPEMLVLNVNARDYEPANKYMHDTVRTSIIKTAKQS